MKTLKLALCAATASFLMAGAAAAQDSGPTFSFNLGLTSDYVFRGVTQTDQEPALQGGVDMSAGVFYAGIWGSNVDFFDETDAEVDVYFGVKPTFGPISADFAAIYYGYVNEPNGADYAYWEFKAAGSVPVGPGSIGTALYVSPDFFGSVGEAAYYEVNGAFPVMDKLSLTGALGRQDLEGNGDYTTWNLGAAYALTDNLSIDLRYHDTSKHEFGEYYEESFVASIKATF
ncbi:TorF family putative porin [Caulobacter sp. NIBR2454]|uniref:TorF family putative porin n=1 Tax=Caulobacter sp. NIBR2454 TaxID=3015996 RepID=UPI0022B74BFE|nr:TorF family putative porin [Caulobacter sp. NIBR2454]